MTDTNEKPTGFAGRGESILAPFEAAMKEVASAESKLREANEKMAKERESLLKSLN